MTSASAGPDPHLLFLSALSGERDTSFRTRREAFLFSMLGQAAVMALIVYFSSCVIRNAPEITRKLPNLNALPLIFSGDSGGGGGGHDPLPASQGNLPEASLDTQIVPPTVIVPKEMPRLPVDQTVVVAPDVKIPQGGQIGDPTSPFSRWLSNGSGTNGIGTGCCGGDGPSAGPGAGPGPSGIHPAGRSGVGFPEAIYSPEPGFSDEARQTKTQGIVLLMIVVGKDGRPYDIRVRQSLGMGLDEKAIEAVGRWRFRPAMLNGQPVATRIAVQVDFHLY